VGDALYVFNFQIFGRTAFPWWLASFFIGLRGIRAAALLRHSPGP
jgi:hypothetical protein